MQLSTSARRLGLAAILVLAASAARAASADITLPGDQAFPESIGSTSDGTLYVGSPAVGGVLRIRPGVAPEVWIKPAAFGTRSTFGILADEKAGILWVCSNDVSALGAKGPSDVKGSFVKGFDLKTGEGKISVPLPGARAFCNDIAAAPDGSLLVTNSLAPTILQLKPGAKQLDVWAESPMFAPPKQGAGLDGIIFGSDGNVYVDLFNDAKLFRVDAKDGKAGKVTQLKASRAMQLTDALRDAEGASFLMIEGSGKLDRVTIKGDEATLETLKDGMLGPTGVTRVGDTAFVTEGQLPKLFGRGGSGGPSLPFKVYAVPVK